MRIIGQKYNSLRPVPGSIAKGHSAMMQRVNEFKLHAHANNIIIMAILCMRTLSVSRVAGMLPPQQAPRALALNLER